MNVTELIELVDGLSFNSGSLTKKERQRILRYLNLANLELWRILINSPRFMQIWKMLPTKEFQREFAIPDCYHIKYIFDDKNQQLTKSTLADIANMMRGNAMQNDENFAKFTSQADKYFLFNNKIYALSSTKALTLIVVPNCKTLVEQVTDKSIQTDTPVFAEPFHSSLVHGAVYWLYISSKGFAEKIQQQKINWDKEKIDFKTFYDN